MRISPQRLVPEPGDLPDEEDALPGANRMFGEAQLAMMFGTSRSPSSALLHPFFGEGSPTKMDHTKKSTVPLFYPLYWST